MGGKHSRIASWPSFVTLSNWLRRTGPLHRSGRSSDRRLVEALLALDELESRRIAGRGAAPGFKLRTCASTRLKNDNVGCYFWATAVVVLNLPIPSNQARRVKCVRRRWARRRTPDSSAERGGPSRRSGLSRSRPSSSLAARMVIPGLPRVKFAVSRRSERRSRLTRLHDSGETTVIFVSA